MKKIKLTGLLLGLVGIVSLAACQANSITGPSGKPLVVVASSENPTSDLFGNNYRRSITVGSASELTDTVYHAEELAENTASANNESAIVGIVFSQDWYDSLNPPSGETRASFAARNTLGYAPDTGSAHRLCNAMFVDASIPTAGRQAMYDAITNFQDLSSSPQPGAKFQYRLYSADPGNELVTWADACYGEGV